MTVGELLEKLQKVSPSLDICVDVDSDCFDIQEVQTWRSGAEDSEGSFVSLIIET